MHRFIASLNKSRNQTSINTFIMNSVDMAFKSILSFALLPADLALIEKSCLVVFGLNMLLYSRSVLGKDSYIIVLRKVKDPINVYFLHPTERILYDPFLGVVSTKLAGPVPFIVFKHVGTNFIGKISKVNFSFILFMTPSIVSLLSGLYLMVTTEVHPIGLPSPYMFPTYLALNSRVGDMF